MASGGTKTKAKRGSNFKKKIKNKLYIWLRVEPKPKQKAGLYGLGCLRTEVEEGSMASVLNRG